MRTHVRSKGTRRQSVDNLLDDSISETSLNVSSSTIRSSPAALMSFNARTVPLLGKNRQANVFDSRKISAPIKHRRRGPVEPPSPATPLFVAPMVFDARLRAFNGVAQRVCQHAVRIARNPPPLTAPTGPWPAAAPHVPTPAERAEQGDASTDPYVEEIFVELEHTRVGVDKQLSEPVDNQRLREVHFWHIGNFIQY